MFVSVDNLCNHLPADVPQSPGNTFNKLHSAPDCRYPASGASCQDSTGPRCRLISLRRFFICNLRSRVLFGTLVRFRTGCGSRASRSIPIIRAIASSLFLNCERWLWSVIRITPSLLARLPAKWRMRCFWISVSLSLFATSNDTVTRVLVLFTCCPPGPPLRDAVTSNASSGITTPLPISNQTIALTGRAGRVSRRPGNHHRQTGPRWWDGISGCPAGCGDQPECEALHSG